MTLIIIIPAAGAHLQPIVSLHHPTTHVILWLKAGNVWYEGPESGQNSSQNHVTSKRPRFPVGCVLTRWTEAQKYNVTVAMTLATCRASDKLMDAIEDVHFTCTRSFHMKVYRRYFRKQHTIKVVICAVDCLIPQNNHFLGYHQFHYGTDFSPSSVISPTSSHHMSMTPS